jgi:hypothetical protein
MNKDKICQNCKKFKNNPGKCKEKNDFTPRKATCSEFIRK